MELGFISVAFRRFWPVIVIVGLLGAAPGWWLERTQTAKYESRAILMVRPPSESRSQTWTGDPDRYVIGQLGRLGAESLAESVASNVGRGLSTEAILDAVEIFQQPATDLVNIVARSGDAESARQIADAYVALYFVELRQAVEESQKPDLDQLNEDIAALDQQMGVLNDAIQVRMAPFLDSAASNIQFTVPGVDQVAPDLQSAKDALFLQYSQLLTTKTELELSARLRVTSEVVQRATLPDSPTTPSFALFMAAGGAAGVFLGFLLAVLLARLSPKVTGKEHVAQLLGQPLVGEFPFVRSLAGSHRIALEALPGKAAAFVDELCVRAEASSDASALTVVVAGTERASGTTTLAAAMANRFAAAGHEVLLIDVDLRQPDITRQFASHSVGIPGLLALADGRARLEKEGVRRIDPFSRVGVAGVRVVGVGNKGAGANLRRQQVPELLSVAAANAHVVIFDGGPLLDAATTVQLTQMVDAVVLAVPVSRQRVKELLAVARQLVGHRGTLLPVSMPTKGRSRASRSTADNGAASPVLADAEVELLESSRR